jgi:hypothetical protein
MAIQTNIAETGIGVDFPTAYIKIIDFSGNSQYIQYRVVVFATQEARQKNAAPIDTQVFACPLPENVPIFQHLYENLKQQNQFVDSEDC